MPILFSDVVHRTGKTLHQGVLPSMDRRGPSLQTPGKVRQHQAGREKKAGWKRKAPGTLCMEAGAFLACVVTFLCPSDRGEKAGIPSFPFWRSFLYCMPAKTPPAFQKALLLELWDMYTYKGRRKSIRCLEGHCMALTLSSLNITLPKAT